MYLQDELLDSNKIISEETKVNKEEKIVAEKEKLQEIKELGTANGSSPDESVPILSIIGQVEGHGVLPPQTKATKYEHIIPQLLDSLHFYPMYSLILFLSILQLYNLHPS